MIQQLELLWSCVFNSLSHPFLMQAGTLRQHAPFVHHPQHQWPCASSRLPFLQDTCWFLFLDVTPDGEKEGLPNLIATDARERFTWDPLIQRRLLHCEDNGAAARELTGCPEDAIPQPLRLMKGTCQGSGHNHTQSCDWGWG